MQMEAAECGAAALAMVLAYHGAWIPLERLRIECGVSRDGSKASNILRAAQRFGLSARAFRQEPSTLHLQPMPCIIHWDFNHFVVLEGIEHNHAFINDPAFGRRRIDMAELDRSFTGVVLVFEPPPTFKAVGVKPNGLRLLLRELRESKKAVFLLVILSVASIVPGVVSAGFSKIFVDDILIQHTNDWLRPLLLGMAATALLRGLLSVARQSLLLRLQTKLAVVMVSRSLWRIMALPIEFFAQRHAGDIATRVSANEQVARLLSGGVATNALNLTSVLFFAIAMAIYDVPLAVICIGLSVVNVVALRSMAERRQDSSRSLALDRGKLVGAAVGTVRTIETIKASGLEDEAFAYWSGIQAKVLNAERELATSSIFLDMLPTLISGLTIAVMLGVGGLRVIDGALTLGSLVAFQSLMASFSEPVMNLVNQAGSVQLIKGALERLEDIYNYPRDGSADDDIADDRFPPKLTGRVELKDVQFGYSVREAPLISGLWDPLESTCRHASLSIL